MAPPWTLINRYLLMSEPANLIDALPGLKMHVADVTRELSSMWASVEHPSSASLRDFRASQLNLVLHLGLTTTPKEALERFNTAVAFAQQTPCRIIVLCPMGHEPSDRLVEAKLYAQCFVGNDLRDMCCCEALMLGYPTREAGFLTNQVSTWLEGDLPLMHWFNRVPAERIQQTHLDFLKTCRAIVYDSAIELPDFIDRVDWPAPERVSDLAFARILPIRQSLGQFLSSIEPSRLIEGLASVEIACQARLSSEAVSLGNWCRERLEACSQSDALPVNFPEIRELDIGENSMEMHWHYTHDRHLHWQFCRDNDHAQLTWSDDGNVHTIPLPARCLEPVKALNEALYFG